MQYAIEGIWTSNHMLTIALPEHLGSLYKDWQDSPLPSLAPFQTYYQGFKAICVNAQLLDQDSFLIINQQM